MEHPLDQESLRILFSRASYQLKDSISDIHTSLQRIAPLDQREDDDILDKNAAMMMHSFYRLRRLAENLEEVSQLDTLPAPSSFSNDDIVVLTRTVVNQVNYAAQLLGLTLTFHSTASSCIISMNAARIERMLLNLLSNAFQFTPRGGEVMVEVLIEGRQVTLKVSDTGCGISPEPWESLYALSPRQNSLCLGLGLPIVQKIAKDHGGTLCHLPREGGGTVALVTLERKLSQNFDMKTPVFTDYSGGFQNTLLELADVLPHEAFLSRLMD